MLRLKICEDFRSKDTDWRFWIHVSCSLIYFDISSPGKAQFISQLIKLSHIIKYLLFITCILSFHYFMSFWALLTTPYLEHYKRYWAKGSLSLFSVSLFYVLFRIYLVIKGVVDLPLIIAIMILLYHESSSAEKLVISKTTVTSLMYDREDSITPHWASHWSSLS